MPLSQAQLNALKTASNNAVTKMNAALAAFTTALMVSEAAGGNSTDVKNLVNQLVADGAVPPEPVPHDTDVLGQPIGSGPRNFGAVTWT